jgi:hypothetical protein
MKLAYKTDSLMQYRESLYTNLHDLERLDLASILNVRPTAQINESAATVNRALLPLHKVIDVVELIFAIRKHLLEVLLAHFQPVKALSLLKDLSRFLIQRWPI